MGEFKKILSFRVILFITINSIIGSGMFFLPSIGVKYAGPASLISWAVLSIAAIYTAIVFSEMASMFPKAGGIYEFCKQAYGSFTSFIIGWIAWIVGNITTAMLIVGAIQYLMPGTSQAVMLIKLGLCIFWVLVFNLMAYRGMKTSSFMLVTFAIITITIILILIFSGMFHLNPENMHPFFLYKGIANISYILLAIFFISEAFFGLESVLFLSEETKKPEKTIPKALISATIIVALLTLALVLVSLLVVPSAKFASSAAPFADMALQTMGGLGQYIIILGTFLVIIGAAAGWIVTGPRLIVSLTRDHMFPPKFGLFHPSHGSPYNAIKFQAAVTSLFIVIAFGGSGYETLLAMLIPFVLVMMAVSILAVIILRIRHPELERPFRAPFVYAGTVLLIIYHITLIAIWIFLVPESTSILTLCGASILLGIPVYYFLQVQYNPRAVERSSDFLAPLRLFTARLILPKQERKRILSYMGDFKDKKIYEYGCNVGIMTVPIADKLDSEADLYATDISRRSLKIANKRINLRDYKNVWLIYDPLQAMRVHPNVPEVNLIVSVGALSYIEMVDTVLSEMNSRLVVGDSIIFMEYDKIFHLISNVNWLKNDSIIRHIFRRNGFLVNVKRKNSIFWQYVYIFGKKVMDSHQIDIEDINLSDIFTNLKPISNIKDNFRQRISEFKEDISNKELGVLFQIDKSLDNIKFFANYRYFEEIIEFLFKVVFKYSIDNTGIHIVIRQEGKSLQMIFGFHPEEHIVDLMTKLTLKGRQDEEGEYVKTLNNLIRLKKVIIHGYKGKVYISESERVVPVDFSDGKHTIIFGELDEEDIFSFREGHLNIDIEIPLISFGKKR